MYQSLEGKVLRAINEGEGVAELCKKRSLKDMINSEGVGEEFLQGLWEEEGSILYSLRHGKHKQSMYLQRQINAICEQLGELQKVKPAPVIDPEEIKRAIEGEIS